MDTPQDPPRRDDPSGSPMEPAVDAALDRVHALLRQARVTAAPDAPTALDARGWWELSLEAALRDEPRESARLADSGLAALVPGQDDVRLALLRALAVAAGQVGEHLHVCLQRRRDRERLRVLLHQPFPAVELAAQQQRLVVGRLGCLTHDQAVEVDPDHIRQGEARKAEEAGVGRDDGAGLADDQTLDRCIGEIEQVFSLDIRAAQVAQVNPQGHC